MPPRIRVYYTANSFLFSPRPRQTESAARTPDRRIAGIIFIETTQPYHNSCLMKEFVTPAKAGVQKKASGFPPA
jgi:hypothetical protein